jgi:alkylated DNA nucleotide flippase Atl1
MPAETQSQSEHHSLFSGFKTSTLAFGSGTQRSRSTPKAVPSTGWQARLAATVADLSPGEVVSYREVACRAGRPLAARSVGSFLSRRGDTLPWWRVVHADGRVAAHKAAEHSRRLRAEGIEVLGGRVVAARAPQR